MLTQKWTATAVAAGAAMLGIAVFLHTTAPTRSISLPEVSTVRAETGTTPAVTLQVRAEAEPVPPAVTYLLHLDGDELSVYASGQKEAVERHTVPAGLPDYDRILLEYGMQIATEEELRQILEDYLS